MTGYLTDESQIAPYMVFPRFLMDMDLPMASKILYVLLLDRARLSMRNEGWQDESGHVFIIYTITSLAEDLGRSEMTIKNGLRILEEAGLIERRQQGRGNPNHIFLKVPAQTDRFLSAEQTDNCPPGRQKSFSQTDRKLSANKNYVNKTIKQKTYAGNGDKWKGFPQKRTYEYKEGESL